MIETGNPQPTDSYAPGGNWTPNLRIRSPSLYPIELQAHKGDTPLYPKNFCKGIKTFSYAFDPPILPADACQLIIALRRAAIPEGIELSYMLAGN